MRRMSIIRTQTAMSTDTTTDQAQIAAAAASTEIVRMRIGFDFTAAGKRFVTYVKQLAAEKARATGGLRAIDFTLRKPRSRGRAHPSGPIPERKLTFYFVELEGTRLEIGKTLRSMLPLDQVAPNQYSIEARDEDHVHVLATGIGSWLVCRGEAEAPVNLTPPLSPTPAAGDATESSNVVEFRRAA